MPDYIPSLVLQISRPDYNSNGDPPTGLLLYIHRQEPDGSGFLYGHEYIEPADGSVDPLPETVAAVASNAIRKAVLYAYRRDVKHQQA